MIVNITKTFWLDLEDIVWFRLNYIEDKFEIKLRNDPDFKLQDKDEAIQLMYAWQGYKANKRCLEDTAQNTIWKIGQIPNIIENRKGFFSRLFNVW